MSQFLPYGRSSIPTRRSPQKEFLRSLASQWSALLGSGAQPSSQHLWPGEVGGPQVKEQPSMFLSAATVGGWGPPRMVPWQAPSTGRHGAGADSGDGSEVARGSLGGA